MKTFRFPLDKALHWRRTQLELEQLHAQGLAARIGRIDGERSELIEARSSAEREIRQSSTVEARDLASMAAFQLHVRKQEALMRERRATLERELEAHRNKLVEAQRKVKLIEKLRGKRLAQWGSELAREQERFAAEAHLARSYTRADRAGAGTSEGTVTALGSNPALANTTYTMNPAKKL